MNEAQKLAQVNTSRIVGSTSNVCLEAAPATVTITNAPCSSEMKAVMTEMQEVQQLLQAAGEIRSRLEAALKNIE